MGKKRKYRSDRIIFQQGSANNAGLFFCLNQAHEDITMIVNMSQEQLDAISRMHNGCILCSSYGSGKSRTAIGYYYRVNGGDFTGDDFDLMKEPILKLYIITTAMKRDTQDWEKEMMPFLIKSMYDIDPVVDSWNNITKYSDVEGAFFIFDEQRAIRMGAWGKAFVKIAKHNQWIMLSATPGDTWEDYIPAFIANGFYRNITDFKRQHCILSPYIKGKIDGFVGTRKLERLRSSILVDMDYISAAEELHTNVWCSYDRMLYRRLMKERYLEETDEFIDTAAKLCYELRRIANCSGDRANMVQLIVKERKRVIIFYNYDFELEILKNIDYGSDVIVAERNGHKHEELPDSEKWVYLVNYASGAEGWNCTSTNVIIFFSQSYSYKAMVQSYGRINRRNTKYQKLYYYHLRSHAPIDDAIAKTLSEKKDFNEKKFVGNVNQDYKDL